MNVTKLQIQKQELKGVNMITRIKKAAMSVLRPKKKIGLISNVKKYWPYYIMVLPGLTFFLVFKYIPMLGSMIAFQDYSVFKGILDSEWVGLKHFKALLTYPDFIRIFTNTLVLVINIQERLTRCESG